MFWDHEKVDGTPNAAYPPIVTSTISNHLVLGILIDDGSSCDQMYLRIFMKLVLHIQDLKSYEGRSLLALNGSLTRPNGAFDQLVFFEEEKNMRIANMIFCVVPYKMPTTVLVGGHSWKPWTT